MTVPFQDSTPPALPRSLAEGSFVGHFRVETLLGSGGMGEVYRAWDPSLERPVALKALRPSQDQGSGNSERFKREALALAQLNHPHVCQVHDWVDDPRGAFIVMELVDGETLDQAAPHLAVREKLQVIRAVALALQAAHAKGIVHRDLKPGNIMVGAEEGARDRPVKVLDFGLARLVGPTDPPPETPPPSPNLALLEALEAAEGSALGATATGPNRKTPGPGPSSPSWDRLTQAGTFMGSPGYASPEQIQGLGLGASSDVFSLGIVAWELLAGEHPFPGEGRTRMRAILDGSHREMNLRGLPGGTRDLLLGMLDPHPCQRPSAAKVAELLEGILRPRRLLPWILASAATTGVLLLAGNWLLNRGVIADLTRHRPARLALLPFSNASGDATLDPMLHYLLPELIEATLRESTKLAPIDPELILRARNTLRLPPQGDLAAADQQRLAVALGAQLLLRGALTKGPGQGHTLSYELRDAWGALRAGGSAQMAEAGHLGPIPLADKVSRELLKAVDPSLLGRAPRASPEPVPAALEAHAKGTGLLQAGNFKDAAPCFQAAAQLAPDFVPAVLGYARCLSRLAEAPSEPVFQWARWAARAQGRRFDEMRALHHLSVRQGDRGQWQASDQCSQAALKLAQALGATEFEAGIHATLGVNQQRQNHSAEAEAEYEKAVLLYQAIGEKLSATRALNNLAVLQKGRGDLRGAEARYLDALRTVQGAGDRWGESFITNNLGDLALAQEGGLDRAEGFYRKAQSLRLAIGDQNGLAYSYMGLASVAQARGELDRAEGLEQQFLDQARRTQLRPLEALAWYNLGELARTAGRFESARSRYRQSLALHQELQDALMEAHCLAGEAECLARDGRRGLARVLLERCASLTTEDTPYLLRAKAWLARSEGRSAEARILFSRALREAPIQAPEIVRELKQAVK